MSYNDQDITEMREDINQIRRLLADQIVSTPANGHSKSTLNTDELQKIAKKTGSNIREFFNDKQEQFTSAKRNCEATVKKHPYTSVAVATGIGVIVASLIKRS